MGRVAGEHDPGAFGIDHDLAEDGEIEVDGSEAGLEAIGDGPGVEDAGDDLAVGGEQGLRPVDVEQRRELAGKECSEPSSATPLLRTETASGAAAGRPAGMVRRSSPA